MLCIFLVGLQVVFALAAVLLVVHHYNKHEHDLTGTDRCFQPEDVFVCCDFDWPCVQRCSHEMWVVLCLVALAAVHVVYLDTEQCYGDQWLS
jgi:hypothetical protein